MKEDTTPTSAGLNSAPMNAPKTNGKWQAKDSSKTSGASDESLMDTAKHAYESVVDGASTMLNKVNVPSSSAMMRQYPVQIAIGALVVGFLLGAAITRRAE